MKRKLITITFLLIILVACANTSGIGNSKRVETELTEDEIKSIVFEDAGVLEKDVTDFKISDKQDEIEVFYVVWPKEYTYTLDSKTGDIWNLNIKVNH